MVTITEAARKKILGLLEAEEQKNLALRMAVRGRGPGGFRYEMQFVGQDERGTEDTVVDVGDFQVLVDPESAPNLKGATVDFVDGAYESGFKIENPNPLWTDPKAQAVQDIIDKQVNPGVAMHGGNVSLLDVKDDIAYIQLGGGCQGCGMVDVTLRQGIEVLIKEAVPAIRQVVDTTDHAAGGNPYYQPAKGGQSPFA
ncbi:MAG: iron-sulfur cluster assembly accessory protein [candidate division NC10 bacterium]|jgi:Fe/S biogenesis protein NfuA|nr:iron-sulfur cluster assembly accessory protein [candidate division NC10 bacterium]HZX61183.1 iron-sulfur cluster assembly accessory protein [Candidatus Methylomirabilis sp.]